MAYWFDFDSTNQVLRAGLKGQVSNEELREFYEAIGDQAALMNPQAGVCDFSQVDALNISAETIRELAKRPPAMPEPQKPRCIVAPVPAVFGLARMFQMEGEETRPSLHVVHTMREACAVLGVQKLQFRRFAAN